MAKIRIHNYESIIKIKKAGEILSKILDYIEEFIVEDIDTKTIDDIIFNEILKNKCKPSLIGYNGYPFSSCISVNETICHGIPNKNIILKKGDIVKIDLTISYNDYHCDSARTFLVGDKKEYKDKVELIKKSYHLMNECIKEIKPYKNISNIARKTKDFLKNQKFKVFKNFCGHGIGKDIHEEPKILFFECKYNNNIFFIPGMIITIEPIIYEGTHYYYVGGDGWSIIKKDKKNSSHFEHTVLITKNGYEILSYSEKLENQFSKLL